MLRNPLVQHGVAARFKGRREGRINAQPRHERQRRVRARHVAYDDRAQDKPDEQAKGRVELAVFDQNLVKRAALANLRHALVEQRVLRRLRDILHGLLIALVKPRIGHVHEHAPYSRAH